MSKETTFDINPDQISIIGLHLRKETPDYIWDENELRNAIFESLVIQHNLPWDKNIGAPDWDDPQVLRIYRAFVECLQRENVLKLSMESKADGQQKNSGWLPLGTYSVSETVPAGWDQTSAVCSDGSTVTAISLQADETVTCVFTNTEQGKITIVKDARPNDCQDFAFTFTGKPNFSLDDDSGVVDCTGTNQNQFQAFDNLPANANYTVAETLPNAFWQFLAESLVQLPLECTTTQQA